MALAYFFTAIPFIMAAMLGILLPLLCILIYSRFEVGMVAILGMSALEALYLDVGGLQLGIALYYTDLVLLLIGFAAFLRLLNVSDFPLRHRAWLVFCGAVFLSFLLGLATNGSAAGVQVRGYFYFVVAGIYGMSFPATERNLQRLFGAFIFLGLLYVGLSFYRWAVVFIPIRELMPESGSYNVDGFLRVIYSSQALVVAQVLILGLFFFKVSPWLKPARFLTPILFAVVLTLQHRSVWLALLAGIAGSFLHGEKGQSSNVKRLGIFAGILAVTLVPLMLSGAFSTVTQSVESSAERAVAGSDTTGERLESWGEIVKHWYDGGAKSILIGQSFGSDNSRQVHDSSGGMRTINYTAHNLYVQTLFNTGLIGLGAYLVAFGFVLRGLYRLGYRAGGQGLQAQALFVLLVMQMVYYVPYGVEYLQSFVFGVALAYVAGNSDRPVPRRVLSGRLSRI